MKKAILIFHLLIFTIASYGQTDGLNYQAVILNNETQEAPGIDVEDNLLLNSDISLRFTIYDENDMILYQEIQQTQTDDYGMVNVIIGQGEMTASSLNSFNEIEWNGAARDLGVELSYTPGEFTELSRLSLYFLPYAFHRNITATGTLTVDEETLLNSSLTVNGDAFFNGNTTFNDIVVENNSDLQGDVQIGGTADLAGDLNVLGSSNFNTITVENLSDLQGDVQVGGTADLAADLNVTGNTNLQGDVQVGGNTDLAGDLNVQGSANFNTITVDNYTNLLGDLNVAGQASVQGVFNANDNTNLNGQVTINANTSGSQTSYSSYALRLHGTDQGIAVKLNGQRAASKNYMSFLDGNGIIHGRIEGQTHSELINSFRFIWDYTMAGLETALIAAEGLACSFQLDFGEAGVMAAAFITTGAQWVELSAYNELNVGVYFSSGGADYAEWLEREDPLQNFHPGEVVGIRGGKISRNTAAAHQILVISTNPIVLGNQPEEGKEALFERVAFLGQVPVRVVGAVNVGDYIIPSGKNDGLAIAVNPKDLRTEKFDEIIGIAWEEGKSEVLNIVNMAIGLNTNDLAQRVASMEHEMKNLNKEMELIKAMLNGEEVTENKENVESNNANTPSATAGTQMPSIGNSLSTTRMTDEEFENWLNDYGYIFEEIMAKVKADFNQKGADYSAYEEVAVIVDTPIQALRNMRDGQYLESLWQGFERRIMEAK